MPGKYAYEEIGFDDDRYVIDLAPTVGGEEQPVTAKTRRPRTSARKSKKNILKFYRRHFIQ